MSSRVFCLNVLLLAFTLFQSPNAAQVQPTVLVLGTPIEKTLAAGQVHQFQVNMEQDQYVQLVVEQHGIDIVVRVYSPTGRSLGEFDSPNSTEGPEDVSFGANTAGVYTVALASLEQGPTVKAGRYELRIVELRHGTEQELSASRTQDELKARGLSLVSEVVDTIAQIRLPQTRVRAQLQAADLLWDTDQKLAQKLSGDAIVGVNEYLANIDSRDLDSFYAAYSLGMQLRHQVVQSLAPHDPELALNFLRSSRTIASPNGKKQQQLEESQLELWLAMLVIKNDPKQAFQIAENTLKTNPSAELFQTVVSLKGRSPELAAKLASQIVAKIQNSKLINEPQLAQLAGNLIASGRRTRNSTQPGTDTSGSVDPAFLSEDDYRTLVQKAVSEALAYNPSPTDMQSRGAAQNLLYTLRSMSAAVDSVMPGSSASIEKKIKQFNAVTEPNAVAWQKYQDAVNNGSTDAALEAISQAPPEMKEQLYGQLSQKEAAQGNGTRARQLIMDHITNPIQRQQLLVNLDQQAIYHAASQGRIDEALRTIAGLRSERMRCDMLAQMANRIGPGQKRAAAMNMLETARSLVGTSPKPENQAQLNALLEIGKAFAKYDPGRAFEIIDPLIDQLNEITEAARTMNGFGQEFFQNGELNLQNGNNVASMANQICESLAFLTNFDFDHAKATADRMQLPEIRVTAFLAIARRAIMDQNSESRSVTTIVR